MVKRTLVALLLLIAAAVPSAAQGALPRVPPANDDFANRQQIGLFTAVTVNDIDEATVQLSEQIASCAQGQGDHSVWFSVYAPVGQLNIDTTGSNYVTVVTVYPPSSTLAGLHEIGCGYTAGEQASVTASTEEYLHYIRVASADPSPPVSMTLNMVVSIAPPSGVEAPANDSRSTPTPVVFNKTMKVKNLEYATFDSSDPATPCSAGEMKNSVWFSFTLEHGAMVTISSEGTILQTFPELYDIGTEIALYQRTGPDTFIAVDCDQGSGVYYAGRLTAALTPGDYAVALYHNRPDPLLASSKGKLSVLADYYNVIDNGGFEDGLTGWKLKTPSGEAIVTGADAINGDSFRFTGGPDEASKLIQKIGVKNRVFIPAESLLQLYYSTKSGALPPANSMGLQIKLIYSDGAKAVYKAGLNPLLPNTVLDFTQTYFVKRKGPVEVQVKLKNKAVSGELILDDIALFVVPLTLPSRDGVLPVPPAP